MNITFDENCKEFILESLQCFVDNEGYVCSYEGKRVHSNIGELVTLDNFSGVKNINGQRVFITKSIVSLIKE